MEKDHTPMETVIISMDWKDSGVISNENLHPKEVFVEINYLFTSVNTSGDTIIDHVRKG